MIDSSIRSSASAMLYPWNNSAPSGKGTSSFIYFSGVIGYCVTKGL